MIKKNGFISMITNRWFLLFAGSFVFTLVFSILVLGTTQAGPLEIDSILSSDNLLFPSIFLNISKFDYTLNTWQLPGALSFLPDFVICWIISFFTSNPSVYYVVYATVQVSLFSIFLTAIFRLLLPHLSFAYLSLTNVILSLLSLCTMNYGVLHQTFYMYMMSYHTGVYVNVVMSCYLLLRYLKNKNRLVLLLLLVVVWLSSLSDMVYVVAFVIPAACALFVVYRRLYWLYLLLALASIAGVGSFYVITQLGYFSFDLNFQRFYFSNIAMSWDYFLLALQILPVTRLVFFISLLLVVALFIWLLFGFIKKTCAENMVYLFALFLFFMYGAVICAPIVNGSYVSHYDIRYSVHSFYLVVFCLVFVLGIMPFYKRFLGVVLLLLVGLNVWFLVKVIREKSPVEDVRNFVTYYPPASRCIDDFCEKYNVKAGVATYWLSIFPEAYSRKNIKVKCVYSNGAPYYHNQHVNSYYRSSEGQVQSYEFFVAEKEVDSATVCRILGKPQLVERCANLTIYKFPPFRFSVFNSFPFMLNYDSSYYFMPCAHVDLKEIKRKSGITDTARGINLQPGIWLTTYVSRIDSTMNQRNMKVKFSCTLKPDTGTFSGVYIVFKHFNEEKYVSISQSGKTKNTGEPFEGLIYFDVPVTQPNDSLYVNIGNVSQTIVGLESLTFEFLK